MGQSLKMDPPRARSCPTDVRRAYRLMTRWKSEPGKARGPIALLFVGDALHLTAVRDLSLQGAGLLVAHSFAEGTPAHARLFNAGRRFSSHLPLRIMHATLLPEGHYLVGCHFDEPLSIRQLHALLRV